ncbi:MAG: phenylalanine--tRNA ligase subunit beta [Phycisphaerales bacterium]|nr:phenylalanine--tRNA ligase subunit beta [Phycisphaerales bacterium]
MIITAHWLNEYLDRPLDIDALVDALSGAGFGCESREDLPGGDTRLDIEITSNRGDCVSMVGLAREAAAVTGRQLRVPQTSRPEPVAASGVPVENLEHDLCPYYSARVIRGVRVGPSPDWLRQRIESIGQRSVNNVVDITNFVLFELGQPLHAFDLAKLSGPKIVIRRARKGENLTAIDGSKLTLDESMLAIADAQRPVALAGVMGGLDTEVSSATTDIILEAASFSGASVRATSRRLKLMSPSSYRFERGVHPATVAAAADRAAAMIAELCGGQWDGNAIVAAASLPEPPVVAMRCDRCRQIAGIEIGNEAMVGILARLGLNPALDGDGSQIRCTIAPHRLDLTREIDLIEEVVRIHGLDQIEPRDRIEIDVVGLQESVQRRRTVEQALTASGFFEVVTFSFLPMKDAEAFLHPGFELLTLQDDRRKAEPALQASVLPGLLRCRKRNQDLGQKEMRLFEKAACFATINGEKAEQVMLGLCLDAPDRQQGLRAMRSALDAVATALLGPAGSVRVDAQDIAWFEPGAGATVSIGDARLGIMGLLSRRQQANFDIETPLVVAELNFEALLALERREPALDTLSAYPSIQRDLSLVVDDSIPWMQIESGIETLDLANLESIRFVGVYRGKPVEKGRKSVTVRLTFRDPLRTLRHDEVDPQIAAVVAEMGRQVGAVLRE